MDKKTEIMPLSSAERRKKSNDDRKRRMKAGTGKFDKNGKEMMVGDIVHFRCGNNALCGKGVVYFAEKPDRLGEDLFRIRDTTPGKREGRIYPYYEDATYRIDERREEHDVVSESE